MIPGRIQPALEELQSLHDLAKAARLHALAKVASAGGRPGTVDESFDAIRLASALGIMVFEAAGNGNNDLVAFTKAAGEEILNPDSKETSVTPARSCSGPRLTDLQVDSQHWSSSAI